VLDLSAAYNAAYAQGLADRLRQQQQQQMLFQQQQQQLQLQTLCNLITSAHGITPAPAAPDAQGAFAGENDVVFAGLQLLIATAVLLQQCLWQP
jgi:hypothetical protein